MMNLRMTLIGCLLLVIQLPVAFARQDTQKVPEDSRLSKYRNIYDKLHPWTPPTKLDEWKAERQRIRERILVSNGLWPLPEKTELKPKLGKVFQRDGYTVQHAMFASRPGHYVTGLIYRPKNLKDKKVPGILCPHGHWADGRFYDAGDKKVKEQLDKKAEFLPEAARYPLQARFVQLARMGCVVFHYDMVGYADSTAIDHRKQFNDAEALLWLTNKMGLQTWNSIRSLDFISSLPEVDTKRLAVTGASGGGTQSFILAALDDRLAAAFPAVMVSTDMQGGCVCENASYLRIGINNAAIAACFAPKPMAMSNADDWTLNFMKSGLPEMRQVWSLYGKSTLVSAKVWPEFQHNYNWHSRHMMYNWFNDHIDLQLQSEIKEREFKPLSREELSVWGSIEKPDDMKDARQLRSDLIAEARAAQRKAKPANKDHTRSRLSLHSPSPVMRTLFTAGFVGGQNQALSARVGTGRHGYFTTAVLDHVGERRVRRWSAPLHEKGKTELVVLVHPNGVAALADSDTFKDLKMALPSSQVMTCDYFAVTKSQAQLAEILGAVDSNYGGLTYCYNFPLLSQRVNDLALNLHMIASNHRQRREDREKKITLVAIGAAGPTTLLAAALSQVKFNRTIIDLDGFSFAQVTAADDAMMLPGALRYGDIGGLSANINCPDLTLFGAKGVPAEALQPLQQAQEASGWKLTFVDEPLEEKKLPDLLKEQTTGR